MTKRWLNLSLQIKKWKILTNNLMMNIIGNIHNGLSFGTYCYENVWSDVWDFSCHKMPVFLSGEITCIQYLRENNKWFQQNIPCRNISSILLDKNNQCFYSSNILQILFRNLALLNYQVNKIKVLKQIIFICNEWHEKNIHLGKRVIFTLTPAISIINMAAPSTWPAVYAQNLMPLTSVSCSNKHKRHICCRSRKTLLLSRSVKTST